MDDLNLIELASTTGCRISRCTLEDIGTLLKHYPEAEACTQRRLGQHGGKDTRLIGDFSAIGDMDTRLYKTWSDNQSK